MATDTDPIVGNWYEHLDEEKQFQVVDIDEETGIVEIQYFDGDLDTIDLDEWYELDLEAMEPPEDWTGPVDDMEQRDDLAYMENDLEPKDWSLADQELRRRRSAKEEYEAGLDEIEGEDYSEEEEWKEDE